MGFTSFRSLLVCGGLFVGACSSSATSPGPAASGAAGTPETAGQGTAGSDAPVSEGGSDSAGVSGSASASAGSPTAEAGATNAGGSGNSVSAGAGGRPASGGTASTSGGAGGKGSGIAGLNDPGTVGDGDFTVTAGAMQPDLTDKGAPKGKRFQFVMDSTKSTLFDGRDTTVVASRRHLTRAVTVYVPAQYKDGTPAPMLVMQDGPPSAGGWGDTAPFDAVSRALDNLTISKDAARKIPAFIAIGVENGGDDSKGSERGLEYDTLSERYAKFVEQEVLPAVLANATIKAAYPGLAFTTDPEGRGTYGCSSGAAASFTMAWFRPDLFRRVITYSGTFVAQQNAGQPESPLYPLGAWEYHSSTEIIAHTDPNKPIRVHLNANEMDNGYNTAESGHHNWLIANQHMAAALKAKGYHYRYNFVKALGHCDYKAWQATLADTLVWVWTGYPTN